MRLQTDMKAVILGVLASGPRHGYAIAKAIREQSEGALKIGEGQLYPALYALEEQGWVVAEWENVDTDQPRRIYRLTESGSAELQVRAETWHKFAEGVAKLIPPPASQPEGVKN
jgi:DNA-binding PadR family transcriptional regulator